MKDSDHYLMNKLYQLWRGIRTLMGDDAYERYLRHHIHAHPACMPLSRKAYFLKTQQRRWDKINRCC